MQTSEEGPQTNQPIHQLQRQVKQQENTLYNSLCSIAEDRRFVEKICRLYPQLPVYANLRCGTWYCPRFDATCYFKSTDGHTNNWSFSLRRLNLHVALAALEKGGCLIVDATRKGKEFPDSMRKTIPIWCCVLNRYIQKQRLKRSKDSNCASNPSSFIWDSEFYAPITVSESEKSIISSKAEQWIQDLENSNIDLTRLVEGLSKPLRSMWISQSTKIWTRDVAQAHDLPFTPIICVSSSLPTTKPLVRGDWTYVQGAADDEENIMMGLTYDMFSRNMEEILESGKDACHSVVLNVVGKERAFLSAELLQTSIPDKCNLSHEEDTHNHIFRAYNFVTPLLSIGSLQALKRVHDFDAILNLTAHELGAKGLSTLHIPISAGKSDKHGLESYLPEIIGFVWNAVKEQQKVLICCDEGTDKSPAVALACLVAMYKPDLETRDSEEIQNLIQGLGPVVLSKDLMKAYIFHIMQKHPQTSISRQYLQQINRFFLTRKGIHKPQT